MNFHEFSWICMDFHGNHVFSLKWIKYVEIHEEKLLASKIFGKFISIQQRRARAGQIPTLAHLSILPTYPHGQGSARPPGGGRDAKKWDPAVLKQIRIQNKVKSLCKSLGIFYVRALHVRAFACFACLQVIFAPTQLEKSP